MPHHLLAAELIGRGYGMAVASDRAVDSVASGRPVRLVAIVGPNHRNAGGGMLTTAAAVWRMPDGGGVAADAAAVRALSAEFGASVREDADAFGREHSVGVHAPFVRHFFPEARILPVILDSNTDRATAERLGRWLAEYLGDDGLAVFSIDFSHYLTEAQARTADTETRRLIEAGDLEAVSRLTNDNVDSPGSLIAAMVYARDVGNGRGRLEILDNTNANDFLQLPVSSTTSHFLMVVR
jgi:AmmeMemoRadiSam system protein B